MKISFATKIKASNEEFRKYESNLIFLNFINFLKNGKMNNVLNIFTKFDLVKDDVMNLSDILLNGTILYKEISTKTKSELTRAYNKLKRKLIYMQEDVKKAKNTIESKEDETEDFY